MRHATTTKKLQRPKPTFFDFSLRFTGSGELNDDQADALFEAGCDDALYGFQNGEYFLDFHRKAPSFRVALLSAIADVERPMSAWS